MSLLWQLLPFFLVAWLLILLIPVRINLYFQRKNKDDFFSIRVNTFGSLIRLSLEVPVLRQESSLDLTLEAELKAGPDKLIREEEKKLFLMDVFEQVRRVIAYLRRHRRQFWFLVRLLARATKVEGLSLHVAGGTREAALTGLLAGLYWTGAGAASALARQWLTLRCNPQFSLTPSFGRHDALAVCADSSVSLYIGHFVLVGVILMNIKIRKD